MIERIDKDYEENLNTSDSGSDVTSVASQSFHHSVRYLAILNFKH